MLPLYIKWDIDPVLFEIGALEIRYYGLFFALSFFLGYKLARRMAKGDGWTDKDFDRWLIYVMVGTVVGARLGHVIFYDLSDYLANPIEIFMVWKGGLASHGAVIGIITSAWLLQRKRKSFTVLYSLDRAVVAIALAGIFIRLGNLMNSEIIGEPTTGWGFWFTRVDAEEVVRHPSQLYEALCYVLIFGAMLWLYFKKKMGERRGFLLGAFMVMIFLARFLVEFTKSNQASFIPEDAPLNMGQYLSIPLIIIGTILMLRAMKKPRLVMRNGEAYPADGELPPEAKAETA